ncbi:Protein K10C3.4, isoform a [Aphelenchoides besseyi]|nr:Protein K10C3.4, isoform a [Aphelenchoides besseyi]KAI6207703.1 Protein K10C3.4, isoform a [Aphelenchoides besseyi]
MDVVVYLALAVLFVVFCVSLIVLIHLCRRKFEYNRLLVDQTLRFSKLKHEDMEIGQLSPHISQQLNSNRWLFDVSGVLEHCVSVLKLCHALTDQLAKIPLQDINPQLNEVICEATTRLVPRFDNLLSALSLPKVDVRLIEARACALTTACWSLVMPFYILNPKYKETFGKLVQEMEAHAQQLTIAAEHLERQQLANIAEDDEKEPDKSSEEPQASNQTEEEESTENRKVENRKPEASTTVKETLLKKPNEISQRCPLVTDETAPADPACSS